MLDHIEKKKFVALLQEKFACVILIFLILGIASDVQAIFPNYHFQHYDIDDGLASNAITDIIEDQSGFIWIATQSGLCRFDGYQFKTFQHQPSDSNSISTSQVAHLSMAKDGNIWIGIWGNAFDLFDQKMERFQHYEIPLGSTSFLQDENGDLWIGSYAGLWKLPKGAEVYDSVPEVGQISVASLYKDRSGIIWIGSGDRIIAHNPNNQKFKTFTSDLAAKVFCEDTEGNLWLGSFKGLGLFDSKSDATRWFKYDSSKNTVNQVNCIYEDHKKNFWIGTNHGLLLFDKQSEKFTHIQENTSNSTSISGNHITTICEDRAGNLWIGTATSGMYLLKAHRLAFHHFQHRPGHYTSLSHNDVVAFDERNDGNIWIGTRGGGLNLFHRKQQTFTSIPLPNRDMIVGMGMLEDHDGYLWISSDNELKRFDPFSSRGVHEYKPYPINPWHLFMDSRDEVWASALFELGRFTPDPNNPDQYYPLPIKNNTGLREGHTNSVFEDSEHNIWICAPHGLYLYERQNDHFTQYLEQETIMIFSEQNSILLIGIPGGFIEYNWKDDSILNRTNFGAIVPIGAEMDDQGNFWVISPNGLYQFNHKNKSIKKYNRSDGMYINKFNTWSSMKSRSGELFFGGDNGFIVFHPDSLKQNTYIPPVVITDFLLANQPVPVRGSSRDTSEFKSPLTNTISLTEHITLPHSQNMFSFHFTALDYTNPSKNRYRYQLRGFNEYWVETNANNRTATYTNLDPGDYTFSVIASNNDGLWNHTGKSIHITILPPWWLTWWAYAGYATLLILAIWSVIYMRTIHLKEKYEEAQRVNKKLEQVDRLKDQFLANTSHEFRTPLQGIIGLSESLFDGVAGSLPKSANEMLKMIMTSGKRLSYLINDILDFSKLKNNELALNLRPVDIHSAANVVLTLANPLLKNKPIKLQNNVPRKLPLAYGDENRIQQIFQNLVGNAIKFTDKGAITVNATEAEENLCISVSDTGIGIEESKKEIIFDAFEQVDSSAVREYAGTGLGLSVTKQLVELHGGIISVQSSMSKGSQFTFTLPKSRLKREDVPDLEFVEGIEDKIQTLEIEPEIVDKPNVNEIIKQETSESLGRILVADDEPINLQVVENFLSMAGYEVTLANDGFEALKLSESHGPFDLIILDVMMPKISGYEVCNKLRDMFLPSELPVVLLTAKNRVSDLVDGFTAGANDYLTKPFSKDELLSRIKTHLHLHKINQATGKFVPFEFLHFIGRESIVDVHLGDQSQQEVTVMFCDIRDYTTLAEDMSPEDNFKLINSFVGKMGPIIRQHQGFVNQFIGDAIMAIFPKDSTNALEASIQMQMKLEEYNNERILKGRTPIHIGIGLHTGPLIMGIIGDRDRTDTTTIADTVNIASRMEGLTKYYGVQILLSQHSYRKLKKHDNFHFRYLGEVLVKGKHRPVKIYECYDGDNTEIFNRKLESLNYFNEGLDHYYKKDFPEASVSFNNIVKLNPRDATAEYYYKLAIKYAMDGVPENWSGIEQLLKK